MLDTRQAFRPAWRFNGKEEVWLKKMCIGFTLNLCSGQSPLGDVKVDLYEKSDIKADMRVLPFREQSFDTVLFDPPFKWFFNVRESFRVIRELSIITRRRIILVGQQYMIPFLKAWNPSFWWKRYRMMSIRWFCIYDRIIEQLNIRSNNV